mmetsp:Transcript_32817/g.60037  ORF Transcript_32817/g.60037 Transcript_32817/m.60037 type:complete len:113 (+) Transcript_32817:78-416(+)
MGSIACCVPGQKVDDFQETEKSPKALKGTMHIDKKVRIDAEKDTGIPGRRNSARKGTGFVRNPPPEADEEEEKPGQPASQGLPKSDRGKARRGTGFVFRQLLPSDLEDEEEE